METQFHTTNHLQRACSILVSAQKPARHHGSAEPYLHATFLPNSAGTLDISSELPAVDALSYLLRDCMAKKDITIAWNVYLLVLATGLELHAMFRNYLILMFVECKLLSTAHKFLHKLTSINSNAWMHLLHALVKYGELQEAVSIFVNSESCFKHEYLYLSLLKACGLTQCIDSGKKLHCEIVMQGLDLNSFIGSSLIDMYAKNGMLEEAKLAFDNVLVKDVVLWSALVCGYTENQCGDKAIQSFFEMTVEGIAPNAVTFMGCLKACGLTGNIDKGLQICAEITKNAYEKDLHLASVIISMYVDCRCFEEAQEVFDSLPQRDVVVWTTLIGGYVEKGHARKSLACLKRMQIEMLIPNAVTSICGLKACCDLGSGREGQQLHIAIVKKGFDKDTFVATAVLDMYFNCCLLTDAQSVFYELQAKSRVVWNVFISGFVNCNCGQEALDALKNMKSQGVSPDIITFSCTLKACINTGFINKGRFLHIEMVKFGVESDCFVGITLLELYCKFGLMPDAQFVFNHLSTQDVTTWNILITCYTQHGFGEQAISLSEKMVEVKAMDAVTVVCSLKACIDQENIGWGRWIHMQAVKQALIDEDNFVGSTLIELYVSCNSLSEAQNVFDSLAGKDTISWGTLLLGYARQGDQKPGFCLMHEMQESGVCLDGVSLLSIITLCNHGGLIGKGFQVFDSLSKEGGIFPAREHYNCMIDTLGRAGQLDEASIMSKEMPFQPNMATWVSLLWSCRKYGDVKFAKQAFDCASILTNDKGGLLIVLWAIVIENNSQASEKFGEIILRHITDDGDFWANSSSL